MFQALGDAFYTSSNKTFTLTTTSPTSIGYAYAEQNPSLNFMQSAYYFTPANSNIHFNYLTFIGDANSNIQIRYTNSNVNIQVSNSNVFTSNVNSITRYNSSNNILINDINNKLYIKYNNSNLIVLSNNLPQSYEPEAYVSITGTNTAQSSNFIHRVKNLYLNNHFAIENNTIINSNVNILGTLTVPRINHTVVGDIGFGNLWAGFSHSNIANATSYALLQSFDGTTLINCSNSKTIGFRINNTEHMTLSAGNVGIGTQTPTAKLHVNGSGFISGTSTFGNVATFNSTLESKGGIKLSNLSVLELGANINKEVNAGKIVYQGFSDDLDIVGAGVLAPNRYVKIWDNLTVPNSITSSNIYCNSIQIGGDGTITKGVLYDRVNMGTSGTRQKMVSMVYGWTSYNYRVFATPEIEWNGQHDFSITIGNKLVGGFDVYAYRNDQSFWGANLYVNLMIVFL